jgi:hypothetical protein
LGAVQEMGDCKQRLALKLRGTKLDKKVCILTLA